MKHNACWSCEIRYMAQDMATYTIHTLNDCRSYDSWTVNRSETVAVVSTSQ